MPDLNDEGWNTDAPGWNTPERVEFLMSDGSIRDGEFAMDDSGFDGESSYPIWGVDLPDGTHLSFYDNEIKGWREKRG